MFPARFNALVVIPVQFACQTIPSPKPVSLHITNAKSTKSQLHVMSETKNELLPTWKSSITAY